MKGFSLVILAFLLAAIAILGAAKLPLDAVEAHRYADGVLMPRFTAAINDWAYQHPTDTAGHEYQHCHKLDAGDVERWRKVRETFKEIDEALKRAGY